MQILNIPLVMLSASLENFLKLIVTLLIFIFVLAITYLTTKWVGGYQKVRMKSKNLQIIETISAGNNKMISLIKAGNQYLVVAVGKEEIHPLAVLTEEQLTDFSFLNQESDTVLQPESFEDIFVQLKDKINQLSKKSKENK